MEIGPDSRILEERVPHYKAWKAQIEPFVVIQAPSLTLFLSSQLTSLISRMKKEISIKIFVTSHLDNSIERIDWNKINTADKSLGFFLTYTTLFNISNIIINHKQVNMMPNGL